MKEKIYAIIAAVAIVVGGMLLYSKNNDTNVADVKHESEYNPHIVAENFSTVITNPYFALTPGKN